MSTKKEIELEAAARAALAVLKSAADLGRQDGIDRTPSSTKIAIAHLEHGLKAAGCKEEG